MSPLEMYSLIPVQGTDKTFATFDRCAADRLLSKAPAVRAMLLMHYFGQMFLEAQSALVDTRDCVLFDGKDFFAG